MSIGNVLEYVKLSKYSWHGDPSNDFGNGIYGLESQVSIYNSVFEDGISNYRGGALAADSSVFNLYNCTFQRHLSGAIIDGILKAINHSNVNFSHCVFRENDGIFTTLITCVKSNLTFYKSLFYNNANDGAPFVLGAQSKIDFINNTVSDNPIQQGYFMDARKSEVSYINNIFWQNTNISGYLTADTNSVLTVKYNCMDTLINGIGNFSSDPLFISPANRDFTLSSSSPCIDGGDPSFPWDPDSTLADLGAFYFDQTVVSLDSKHPSSKSPTRFKLYNNYPNPFNPETNIEFDVMKSCHVQLTIYDVQGRLISRLINEDMVTGNYRINFKAHHLASGLYFYNIRMGEFKETKKMILSR